MKRFHLQKRQTRRGAITVLAAILAIVFVAMVAFSVDIGYVLSAKEELQRLELSLLEEGCRDPLVVWKEQGILLDGHNRLALCQRHSIPFQRTFVELLPILGILAGITLAVMTVAIWRLNKKTIFA